jgi:hypothetical protein
VPLDDLTGGGDAGTAPCVDTTRDPRNCGTCGHSCRGGTCVQSLCQPITVATGQDGPLGIFVPPSSSDEGQFLFWVWQGQHSRPSLRRAFKDGREQGGVEGEDPPAQLPFDLVAANGNVYWTEGNFVYKRGLNGAQKVLLGPAGAGEGRFLAVDGSRLFIVGQQGGTGVIVTQGTAQSETVYNASFVAGGLAISGTTLFWIEQDKGWVVSGMASGVQNGNKQAMTGPQASGLAVDDRYFYWTEDHTRLVRAPRDNPVVVETIYTSAEPFGDSDVGVDDEFVYWTEFANGLVRRLAK